MGSLLLIRCFVDSSHQQQMVAENNGAQGEQMNVQSSPNVQNQMFDNTQNVGAASQPFRPPLPPSHLRPQRLPFQVAQQMLIRQKIPPVCNF